MTTGEKELIKELSELFLDKVIGKIKFENEDEKTGAWLLKEYQFNKASLILTQLELIK